MRHTIAGLRAVVIAKTLFYLSSPGLATTCVGEASISGRGGRKSGKNEGRGKEEVFLHGPG